MFRRTTRLLVERARAASHDVRAVGRSVQKQFATTPPPIPPEKMRFMNEDEPGFLATGDELTRDARAWAGLDDASDVLDVGSGYGRFAHALLRAE